MAYSTATLEGTYRTTGGDPASGVVEIIPNSRTLIDPEGNVILSGRVKVPLVEVTWDKVDPDTGEPVLDPDTGEPVQERGGRFSVTLPSTDDTTVEPATGRQYAVSAKLKHTHLAVVTGIELAGGSTVDMADVTPAAETAAAFSVFLTAEEYAADMARVAALEGVPAVTKASLGLGSVDNTSDANKPVSTAQQTALNAKLATSLLEQSSGVAGLTAAGKLYEARIPDRLSDASLSATYARVREHQRARLRAIPEAPILAPSPPTITKQAAGGASGITGAVLVQSVDDPRYRILGGSGLTKAVRYAGPPIAYDNHQVTSTLDQLGPWSHSFMHYGTKFAFRITETSPAGWYYLRVDGRPVTAIPTPVTGNTASSFSFLVDFGSAAARRIDLQIGFLGFAGIYIGPTDGFWAPTDPPPLRSVWLGDSFTFGANASGGNLFVPEAARLLGWDDCYVSGEQGTGYVNPGSGGGRQKFAARVVADVAPHNPDVIVVQGSTNDVTYTAAQVGTEAAALYAQLATSCPGVPVYVVGIQYPNNTGAAADGTRDPLETAMRNAALAAPNVKGFISTKGWFYGTGTVAAPAGSGVNDVFTSSDGLHPTTAGHQYYAKRVAQAIGALLTAA